MSSAVGKLTALQSHDEIASGLSVGRLDQLLASLLLLPRDDAWRVLGVSARTLDRYRAAGKALDANVSDRLARLERIVNLATRVLGSRHEAERWLSDPATGLEQRRPIDLLQTSVGTHAVETLLHRIDHGIYA